MLLGLRQILQEKKTDNFIQICYYETAINLSNFSGLFHTQK